MNDRPPHLMIVLNRLGTGGVERVALHLANGLAARGNRVTLVLLSDGGTLEGKVSNDVEIVRLGLSLERGPGLLAAARRLANVVAAASPDVLLSPGNHMHAAVLTAHLLARSDAKLALKMTNPVERDHAGPLKNAARRAAFGVASGKADLILALSESAAEEARKIAPASAEKLQVVANPYVDDSLVVRACERIVEDPPILLSAGRLTPQKDPLMMIEALAGLRDRAWRLVMLGEGPLAEDCRSRAEALGIGDRVELAGYVPEPRPWFEKARLFLLSSRYEELPAVLFEALAVRCPIVSTAASTSVVQALDRGRLGTLVPAGDAAAFRDAIATALDGPADAPDAREWLRRFTISAGIDSHARALGLR